MKRINAAAPAGPAASMFGTPAPPAAHALTLEQLRLFLAAARTGNFTHAAEQSFLSQSAFSRQIQALESALGVELFDRVGRHVRLNDAGHVLERRAAEIVARVERLAHEVVPAGKGLLGTIRLGAQQSLGVRLLPTWLAAFAQRYPGVYVNLLLRNNEELLELLRGDSVDAAVVDERFVRNRPNAPRVRFHLSYRDELWVVGPKGIDPNARPGPSARWFGQFEGERRRQLAQYGIVIGDSTRTPGGEVALKFIEAGLGYTLLPEFMARPSWKAGRIGRVGVTLTRSLALVTPASHAASPCVERLVEFLAPKWKAEEERQRRDTEKETARAARAAKAAKAAKGAGAGGSAREKGKAGKRREPT
ncbi:MAG: LysR family transcriptional regulator [Planctomycetes bacterium]|nr:LysR family transcriptional regulator [Planctomycetota bacterium]